MYGQDLRPATRKAAERASKPGRRLQPGGKKSRKQMARVVSVYETEPFVRTPDQLRWKGEAPPDLRPRPKNKQTWARNVPDMATNSWSKAPGGPPPRPGPEKDLDGYERRAAGPDSGRG